MKIRNNLHSFTLRAEASALVDKVPDGMKSRRVSDAISWYYTSPVISGIPSPADIEISLEIAEKENEIMLQTILDLREELNSRLMLKLKRWLTKSQS